MSRQSEQSTETAATGDGAVVAARADDPPVETGEIRALAAAAGYDVRAEVTQVRAEDPGTYFGAGKVSELAERVEATGASLVAVDGELTPRQTTDLREALPDGRTVFDRYRLVLAIFAEQASARRAQLQVELARLKYDLPRLRERSDVQGLNKVAEKGTPIDGVRNRIADLERKLAALPDPAEQHRAERREQGFDLVTFAGYTNAGKSTLLHRVADDLSLDGDARHGETSESGRNGGANRNDGGSGAGSASGDDDANRDDGTSADAGGPGEGVHPDVATETANVADRLFETLETTTRRATVDGRPVLCTDTVGFVADLPHWLVESFSETLSDAAAADAVVLVADASDPPAELREKLRVSLDVLASQGVARESVVTALNKVDLLDERERRERLDAAADLAPDPVPVSVREGTNVDRLLAAVAERLPSERAELTLPNRDDAMSLVSRAHDRTTVERVDYGPETVELVVRGRPEVIRALRADAEGLVR